MSKIFTVTLPDIGEGVVEGEVVEWLKSVGEPLAQDEPVVVVMTDKATVELPAPHPGILAVQYHQPGEVATLGKPLYDIELDGEKKKVKALPKTRHLAKEMGVDLQTVKPSGADGRVMTEDLYANEDQNSIPLTGIRGAMARKMTESKRSIPHFSYFEQTDATLLTQLRQNISKAAADVGIHLTYMPFFIRALSLTLRRFPIVNGSIDEATKKHVLHPHHNVGFAMATDDGLIVPVLKRVEAMSLEEIIRAYDQLRSKALEGGLGPEELRGATFTISNYGVLGGGGRWATPIISPPEVGILALARIHKAPVVKKGELAVRDVLNLSWSFDHRVIDGNIAAQISDHYSQIVQNPASLL